MKTKSALFICLLAFAFLSVQCHSHEAETATETGTAVTEAISDKAKEVGVATTKAVSDQAVAAKEALQTNAANAAETVKEATPTLTAIKTDVEEKTSAVKKKVEATVKEAKKEAAVKKEATKAKKKKKKKARSAIKFEELSHGFGKIKQGEVIKHDFKFTNVGKAPLVIKKVDVSCGCTFPSYPFIPIEPGKEGVIGITYDSKNKAGRQKPTITVVTNGSPRTLKLHLEGYVE